MCDWHEHTHLGEEAQAWVVPALHWPAYRSRYFSRAVLSHPNDLGYFCWYFSNRMPDYYIIISDVEVSIPARLHTFNLSSRDRNIFWCSSIFAPTIYSRSEIW